ncbi:TIGR00266 family protein [[Eubacterium] yurii subsp. margaretiae ATCC 43715]|nr:TIGR00266 family protein [[Eubacterium] yurii subsp. margaretiae ATCC 43715]
MEYRILYQDTFPMIECYLSSGESIKAESGAMVGMDNTLDIDGKLEKGLMGGLTRMLAGEKIFFQNIKASRGAGKVLLAPTTLGSVLDYQLDGMNDLIVQKDGYLASEHSVDVSTKTQNLAQGLFSGEGFFILKVSGRGTVFLNSYGSIHEIDLQAGQEYIVDNQHLVAWSSSTDYKIEKASSSGWISSLTSGEGLVCRFRGPGKVFIQTRNPSSFARWVNSLVITK